MVAVVTGSGLGLFTSSRSTSGAGGTAGDPQLGRGNESVFVNTTNGNLIIQSLDENLSAVGLDLALVRTYNSQGIVDDDNNDGWRLGAQQRLISLTGTINTANSTITKVFGDGAQVVYTYDVARAAYVSTDGDGAHDTLAWGGALWTWTDGSSRNTEAYNWVSGVGRITASIDANNNQVTYTYNPAGTLLIQAHMAGTLVQDVYFDYYTAAGSTNDLEKIRVVSNGVTQTLTRYTYDASHRLVTVRTDMTPGDNAVTDNDVYVTSYAYDGATYNVTSITQTRGISANVISRASFTYMQFEGTTRIRTVTDGEGRVATYNYSQAVNPGGNSSQPVAAPGWSEPENLMAPGANSNSLPKVAFDANGNGFALWNSDVVPGGPDSRDLIVRRYQRATNSWGPAVVLDTGTASNQVVRVSSLAVDEYGNAIVAWSQTDGAGLYSVYASRYTVATNTWNGPALLENLPGNLDYHPTTSLSVAIASANAIAVSWVQSDGVANSTYVARWNGTSWVLPSTPVESGSAATKQTTLAVDGAGNITALWIQANGGVDNIYYNRFDVTSGLWVGAQTLQTTSGTASRPQLAFDYAGNGLAVWVQDGDIVARRYDKATNTWAAAQVTVDARSDAADAPSLAMDRQSGAGFVAWVQSDGTAASVYTRRFSGTGASWQEMDGPLDGSNESIEATWQQGTAGLATSMRGDQGVVMWCQDQTLAGTNHLFDVKIARLSGSTWRAAETLQYNNGMGGGFFNSVAIDALGNVSAVWDTYYNPGIWVSRYTAPGSWTGAMSLTDPDNQSYFSKTASDANGNIFVVWVSDNVHNVMARRFDKATNTWSEPWPLDTGAAGTSAGETALSVDEYGNAVAVWQQRNAGSNLALYASRYDLFSNTWSAQQLIQGAAQPADVLRPGGFSVQVSGANTAIAWLQKNGSVYDVYGARLTGTTLTGPTLLESAGGTATSVSTSIDKAGNIAVVWQQFDDALSIHRIYVNRFTAAGSTWSGASALSGTSVAATDPKVGFDAVGNGLAIWAQGNDIYAMRYDKVTGWGTAAPIDSQATPTESTSLSVDRQGNAIAAWIQSDGTSKSIYAARYTLGTGWAAAMQIDGSTQAVRTNPGTAAVVVATSIHGNNAAVAWLQKTGVGDPSPVATEAWVARWNGSVWGAAEMTSNAPGITGFDPSVAIDNQGNTVVAWAGYSDRSQIFVNRYNANTPWSGEVTLGANNVLPGIIRTSYDSAGNGFAAWSGNVGGVTTMWVNRYDKVTNTWGEPKAVDSGSFGPDAWTSTISADDAGNAVLAWVRHDGTNYSMYASRYSARAGAWSAAVIIDNSSQAVANGASALLSDIGSAISAENNAAVVWLQSNGSVNDVYVSRWNGIGWTATLVDNASATATNVAAAIDLDGNVTATWLQSDGTAASVFQNRYTATCATAGSWGAASQLDIVNTAVSRPMIGFDAYGNAYAAWIQGNDVYTRRYDRAAGTWATAVSISTGASAPALPAMAVDAMGNAVLAWIRNDGTANSVYASVLAAGGTWGAATLLENSSLPTADGYAQGFNVAVAIRAGLAVVDWNQQGSWGASSSGANLYQARWNGSSWSEAEQVDNTAEGNGGYYVTAGIDAQGNTSTVFPHWRGTGNNTYVNRYNTNNSYTQTMVSDASGRITVYRQDSSGRLMSVTAPAVNGLRNETRYQYDRDGNITAIIEDAAGVQRTTVMIYDTRGNLAISCDASGNTTRRTYDDKNQLITETVYMVPDAAGTTQPPLTTRYYYDSKQNLRFVVSPEGRVTQHRYDALGQRTLTFIYTATFYTNAAYSMNDLTDWADLSANLANVERCDYAYTARGLVSTASHWDTTSSGAGTGTPSVTTYTYDQRGLLLTKTTPRGSATSAADYITSYAYDAMRRVILKTEWVTSSTTRTVRSVTYDDVSNSVVTTLANGLISTSLYDRSGRLVSTTASGNGVPAGVVTSYAYDLAGRLAMMTDTTGVKTFTFYDDAGRKGAIVDGDGSLTQFFYNSANQLVKTVRYGDLLPAATLNDLSSGASIANVTIKALVDSLASVSDRDPNKDQVSYNVYDRAGRLAASVAVTATVDSSNVSGTVTRHFYNGYSRVTDTVQYALSPTFASNTYELKLADLVALMVPDAANDRITHNTYDGDGKLISSLDGANYLTAYKYDAAGRLTKQTRYWNPGAAPAANNARDVVTRMYYDGQGRKIGTLDGEQYLTETVYDLDGNVAQTARYDKQINTVIDVNGNNAAVGDDTTFAMLKNATSGSIAQVTKYQYDGAGRVTKTAEYIGTPWSEGESWGAAPYGSGPMLAFDSAGNGFAVTITNPPEPFDWGSDITVRRYDAASKTWGAPINLDVGGGVINIIGNAKISMDDAGNAVVAWTQSDDGTSLFSVYAARYTVSDGQWTTTLLEDSQYLVDGYTIPNLSVSIASANAIAVNWVQLKDESDSISSSYVAIWNGTGWTAAQLVDAMGGFVGNVSVAIDTSGRATAVWTEWTEYGDNYRLKYARYSGGTWAPAAVLDTTAMVARSLPQVAFDASGNGFAVWIQGANLLARRFTVAGGWGATTTLDTRTEQVAKPTLAINSAGEAVVAWVQSDGTANSVYVSRFTSSWSAPTLLENSSMPVPTNWQQNGPSIFVAMRGTQAAIAWSQQALAGIQHTNNTDAFVSRWNGTGWDAAQAIEPYYNGWAGMFSNVGIDAQGNTFASWGAMDFLPHVAHTDEGTVTTFAYDNVDNVLGTTRAANTADARTTQARYDLLGRKTQEISAEGFALITGGMTQSQIEDIWSKYGVFYAYDNAGRLKSSTARPDDTQTNITYYYYDADGRLRFTVDPRGQVSERTYNALGQVVDEIEHYRVIATPPPGSGGLLDQTALNALNLAANASLDAITHSTYLRDGALYTRASGAGALETFHYNAFGQVDVSLEKFDANYSLRRNYLYDQRGNLKRTTTDPSSPTAPTALNVLEFRYYDAFGRLREITNARNDSNWFEYDRLGRQVAFWDGLETRRETIYDAFSRVLKVIDDTDGTPLTTEYTYNDATRRVIVTTPERISVATESNRHGETLRVTAGDNTTVYTYDPNGRLKTVSDNLGSLEQRSYDRAGRQVSQTGARGFVTTMSYDASSRLLTRTVGAGAGGTPLTTSYRYDPDNRYIDTTEANGSVMRTQYDIDGRVVAVFGDYGGAQQTRTDFTYDNAGHTLAVVEGAGSANPRRTKYVFDRLGRRSDEYVDSADLGGTLNLRTQYKYDGNGNLTRKIDAAGNSTWSLYDSNDRLACTIDALGGVTTYKYDAQNRQTQVRRFATAIPAATVATFGDAVISLPAAPSAADRIEQTVYDKDGRAVYSIDSLGGVAERTFDANGNVTRTRIYRNAITVPYPVDTSTVASALSAAGNSATIVHADDHVQWTAYDLRGRPIFAVDGTGAVVKTTYDPSGNVIATIAYAPLVALSNAMTTDSLTAWANQSAVANYPRNRVTTFWYDSTNRERFSLDAEGYLVETRYLDSTYREQTIVYAGKPAIGSGATLADVAAAAAAAPNQAFNQITTRTFDFAGRVVQVTDANNQSEYFAYDAVGNKTKYVNKKAASATDAAYTWTYEYDANHRLMFERSPSVTFTFVDPVTLAASESTQQLITYNEYDALGNVTARTEAYGTTQARTTRYEYDALGRQTATVSPTVGIYSSTAGTETQTEVRSETAYDVFGNAFRNRLVTAAATDDPLSNTYTYKAYDKLGRVVYEIDAKRQVTANTYDAFGNKIKVTRLAAPLGSAPWTSSAGVSLADVAAAGLAPNADNDRSIETTYDRLGRAKSVRQPRVGNEYPTTEYLYNAFGDAIHTSLRINTTDWAHTYFYYDKRGLKTAELDARQYLTRYFYDDETGDLTSVIEYARPTTGVPDVDTYGTLVTSANGNAAGDDRETHFAYDQLNRRISETQVNLGYSSINGSGVLSTAFTGTLTTTYGYDVLGNQTRVTLVNPTGGSNLDTYTYYDVLGRAIAVAQPSRNLGAGAAAITPFTRMRRDAHGNLVQQIEYYDSIGTPPADGSLPVTPAGNPALNRVNTILVDRQGKVLRTRDAAGADRYASYNIRGDIARQWQTIQTVNPDTTPGAPAYLSEMLSTTFHYDVLGRQTKLVEPQTATRVRIVESDYNAFGEITERRTLNANGVGVFGTETFEYDHGGRLWRTNADSGVYRVYLYDLAGRATAEIKSQQLDLHASGDLQAVLALSAANLMRSETVYDLLGRTVEQRGPTFELLDSTWTVAGTASTRLYQTLDRWGNVTRSTDELGRTTDYFYNQMDQVIRVVLPAVEIVDTTGGIIRDPGAPPRLRPIAFNYYDLLGNLIGKQDPVDPRDISSTTGLPAVGAPTYQITYNQVGQVIKESANGATKLYTLDGFGQRIQAVDEMGYKTRYQYDRLGNLTGLAREKGAVAFDSAGFIAPTAFPTLQRQITPTQATGYEVIRYTYDEAGRRIAETTGEFTGTSGNTQETIRYWYDLHGNLIRKREPIGQVALTASDASTVLVRYETTYEFNVNGKKIKETDGNGSWMTWNYNQFGQLQQHKQLTNADAWVAASAYGADGDTITYAYDRAGLLDYQSSVFGQSIDYQYDAAGHLRSIVEDSSQKTHSPQGILYGIDRDTNYRYNALGQRVGEQTIIDELTHQNAVIDYDELGRLKSVTDLRASIQYSYDARGNRTRLLENFLDQNSHAQTHEDWYVYDALNRVTISKGADSHGAVREVIIDENQGVELTYDLRGNRRTSRSYGLRVVQVTELDDLQHPVTIYVEEPDYDEHLYSYDGLSRVISDWRYMDIVGTDGMRTVSGIHGPNSFGILADERYYDHASRQVSQVTRTRNINYNLFDTRVTTTSYDDNGRITRQTTVLNFSTESDITYGTAYYDPGYYWPGDDVGNSGSYSPAGWRPGYDAAGVLRGYGVLAYPVGQPRYFTNHSFEYALGDGYLEVAHTAQSFSTQGNPPPRPGSNKRIYNVNGELVSYFDPADTSGNHNRIFATNAAGQVLTAVNGSAHYSSNNTWLFEPILTHYEGAGWSTGQAQLYRYANGQYLGTLGTLQTGFFKANFDTNFEPISSNYPAPVPSQVTIQSGDTLRSIATRIFGDGNLWYVLADANGLTDGPDALLNGKVGWSLRVPNEVISMSNNGSSFKPFSVGDALGDTTPIQPAPPPPKAGGCGVLGQIIVIFIAAVVAYFTVGAATHAFAAATGALTSTGALAATGAGFASAVVGGAFGGAVGSIVSQGVGMVLGVQSEFDSRGIAMGAIGGAVTGAFMGAGELAKAAAAGKELTGAAKAVNAVGKFVNRVGKYIGAPAANAIVSNVLTQGIAVATGIQSSFSWRDVAISAVAAPIASGAGKAVGGLFASEFANLYVAGVAGSYVRRAFGGKVDTATILADAFGNALGNSFVDSVSTRSQSESDASGAGSDAPASTPEVQASAGNAISAEATAAQNLDATEMSPDGLPTVVVTGIRRQNNSAQVRLGGGEPLRGRAKPHYAASSSSAAAAPFQLLVPQAQLEQFNRAQDPALRYFDSLSLSQQMSTKYGFESDLAEPQWVTNVKRGWSEVGQLSGMVVQEGVIGAWQPFGQTLDLLELATIAPVYNLTHDDTYQLTGFSRVADATTFAEALRQGLSYNPLGGAFYGGYDIGTGIVTGDPMQAFEGSASVLMNLMGAKMMQLEFGGAVSMRTAEVGGGYTSRPIGEIPNFTANPVSLDKPRYVFDASTSRYREVASGRFVAARDLPWPDNAGFTRSAKQIVQPGKVLDRFGDDTGRFMGEPGTTISRRGMAPGSEGMPYNQYRVLKAIEMQVGPAAPVTDFGAIGGGTQYLPKSTIRQLVKDEYLRVIKQ